MDCLLERSYHLQTDTRAAVEPWQLEDRTWKKRLHFLSCLPIGHFKKNNNNSDDCEDHFNLYSLSCLSNFSASFRFRDLLETSKMKPFAISEFWLNSVWSFNERIGPKKITNQKRKSPTSTGPGLTGSTLCKRMCKGPFTLAIFAAILAEISAAISSVISRRFEIALVNYCRFKSPWNRQ